jgi:hypothetical protein
MIALDVARLNFINIFQKNRVALSKSSAKRMYLLRGKVNIVVVLMSANSIGSY